MRKPPPPEWSVLCDVGALTTKPLARTLVPEPDVCLDLAERLGVLDIKDVRAQVTLQRVDGGQVVQVSGTVQATVTQECVVTLAPVTSRVVGDIDAYFSDTKGDVVSFARAKTSKDSNRGEVEVLMLDEREAPEPIVNGQIDIGEVATQFLSLAIDPYPRASSAI